MVFGLFNSRSRSSQTTDNSSNDEILNVVNGDGDYNTNLTASGNNNSISLTQTDHGSISEAFDFARSSLDISSANGERANSILEGAIEASRGQAANSENLLKILVTGGSVVAIALMLPRFIK